jgi:hypothetical protein
MDLMDWRNGHLGWRLVVEHLQWRLVMEAGGGGLVACMVVRVEALGAALAGE